MVGPIRRPPIPRPLSGAVAHRYRPLLDLVDAHLSTSLLSGSSRPPANAGIRLGPVPTLRDHQVLTAVPVAHSQQRLPDDQDIVYAALVAGCRWLGSWAGAGAGARAGGAE